MIENFDSRIEEFKKRIEIERRFCEHLFRYATIRLMAFKYAYYVLNEELIKDIAYDQEEKSWYVMGRALGLLKEDDHSPCVDWDKTHKFAPQGKKLALRLARKK